MKKATIVFRVGSLLILYINQIPHRLFAVTSYAAMSALEHSEYLVIDNQNPVVITLDVFFDDDVFGKARGMAESSTDRLIILQQGANPNPAIKVCGFHNHRIANGAPDLNRPLGRGNHCLGRNW